MQAGPLYYVFNRDKSVCLVGLVSTDVLEVKGDLAEGKACQPSAIMQQKMR